jgi:Kdo2-lipid IVA lauroyltransferase/acyltransferase
MSKRQGVIPMLAEYCGVQIARFIALSLPVEAGMRLGETLGAWSALILRKRRRQTEDNLLKAFPGMSPTEARRLAIRVFQHFGRNAIETIRSKRMVTDDTIRGHLNMVDESLMDRILAAKQPAIWVTAHIGVWEIVARYFALRGVDFTSVYRPVKNRLVDRMLRRMRTDETHKLIERKGALRGMIRALKRENRHVVILVDQHVRKEGIWVPFFGRLAATTPAPAVLALQTGAPIIIWHSRRLPGTYNFEAHVDEPIIVEPSGDRAADIERITRQISNRLESIIRETPEQWLWLHRRWRTPPADVVERNSAHGTISNPTL